MHPPPFFFRTPVFLYTRSSVCVPTLHAKTRTEKMKGVITRRSFPAVCVCAPLRMWSEKIISKKNGPIHWPGGTGTTAPLCFCAVGLVFSRRISGFRFGVQRDKGSTFWCCVRCVRVITPWYGPLGNWGRESATRPAAPSAGSVESCGGLSAFLC